MQALTLALPWFFYFQFIHIALMALSKERESICIGTPTCAYLLGLCLAVPQEVIICKSAGFVALVFSNIYFTVIDKIKCIT
jgi:hypothetical protein